MKARNSITVSRTQFAKLIGVTPDRVSKFIAEGLPVLKSGRGRGNQTLLNLGKGLAWFIARFKETPRDRREDTQAKLNQLKLDQARGLLLPYDQVCREGQQYIGRVQAKLRSIPNRLIQEGSVPPESKTKVENLIEECIGEMAGWTSSLEETEKADAGSAAPRNGESQK